MQEKEGNGEITSSRSLFHEMWLQIFCVPFQADSSRHSSIPFHGTARLIEDHEALGQHSQISVIQILAGMFCFHFNPDFLVLKSSWFWIFGFIFGFCGKCLAVSWRNFPYPENPGNFRQFPALPVSPMGLWNDCLAQQS